MLKLNDESISQNVLGRIIAEKKKWLEKRKEQESLNSFVRELSPSGRSLKKALTSQKTCFIMECKKASPSKGLIRPEFHPGELAGVYQHYAQAVSVLAEEHFFQGNLSYIRAVRDRIKLPVICKDFIIDPYQVFLARRYGADAILLMLSVLPDESYKILAEEAGRLGLDVLTEASTREEVERACDLGAQIIGINNRNLRDLTVDLNRVRELAPLIPEDRVKVCESGIYTNEDVRSLSPLVNAFLVGSSLMSQQNVDMACRRLVYGNNKVCGLTRHGDAVNACRAGAVYGGLIFAEGSRRRVSAGHARKVIQGTDLKPVGVFRDQDVDLVVKTARDLHLCAVQLHGKESAEYMQELRTRLHERVEIWKAVPVTGKDYSREELAAAASGAQRILLDTRTRDGFGGTGDVFNWSAVEDIAAYGASLNSDSTLSEKEKVQEFKSRLIVAGGLNAANAAEAAGLGVYALDFNSGVESMPGIKEQSKLREVFSAVRDY